MKIELLGEALCIFMSKIKLWVAETEFFSSKSAYKGRSRLLTRCD